MAFDYDGLQSLSAQLLARFGRTVVVIYADGQTVTTKGVFVKPGVSNDPTISTNQVERTRRQVLLAGTLRSPPVPGTLVISNSISYTVASLEDVQPGPVPLLYKVEVEV